MQRAEMLMQAHFQAHTAAQGGDWHKSHAYTDDARVQYQDTKMPKQERAQRDGMHAVELIISVSFIP